MYLSKSDFRAARTCPTKLHYRKRGFPTTADGDGHATMLREAGHLIGEIARHQFPGGILVAPELDPAPAAAETRRLLESAGDVVLFEAALLQGPLYARADVLARSGAHLQLIEVKSRAVDGGEVRRRAEEGLPSIFRPLRGKGILADWRMPLEDLAFQAAVLQDAFPGFSVSTWLMLPDSSAATPVDRLHTRFVPVPVAEPDGPVQRFAMRYMGDADVLRDSPLLVRVEATAEVEELLPAVREEAARFAASLAAATRIDTPVSLHCKECEFNTGGEDRSHALFAECWGEERARVRPNLFDMYYAGEIGGRADPLVNRLIRDGKISLLDIPEESLVKKDGTVGARGRRQRVQLRNTRIGSEWRSEELEEVLRAHAYPLHFIDFETTTPAVPYHAGMAPYELVAFQWSCHTLQGPDAAPVHSEWIDGGDGFPSFAFAESLMRCIADGGTVFMWSKHERTVLREVRRQMAARGHRDAELDAWLDRTAERLVDLEEVALEHYFHPRMHGRTSIKRVLEAVWDSNAQVRARFPEYVLEEGGEVLSPYMALPPLRVGGEEITVREGTGALRAYHDMLYGAGLRDPGAREAGRRLLLQYCRLDTAAMLMVWWHWLGTPAA